MIFLVCGRLGFLCLKKAIEMECQISAVFSTKSSQDVISLCKEQGIPFYLGNPRNESADSFMHDKICEIIFSINYLYIVEKKIIDMAGRYAINIHGSLLPKYRGRTPHVWAIINGETSTGVTAHIMENEVDTGPVVTQLQIPIEETDTGATLLKKFEIVYPDLLEGIILDIREGDLELERQDSRFSTYFGKRTPEDGGINWSWSRRRIIDWVRALAPPYPGAHSFYKEHKIIFSRAQDSDTGFHYLDANGTILGIEEDRIVVKCGTGAIALSVFRNESQHEFKIGEILGNETD